jgi:hypothetical protein
MKIFKPAKQAGVDRVPHNEIGKGVYMYLLYKFASREQHREFLFFWSKSYKV